MRTLSLVIVTLVLTGVVDTISGDAARASGRLTWQETSQQVDRLFESAWQREHVVPVDIASDEEFIRRIYLDLAGRVPSVSEVRAFLSSDDPNRGVAIVRASLPDPACVRHMTIVWRNALIPQAMTQQEFRGSIPGFGAWLWERPAANVACDRMVREIITGHVLANPAYPQAIAFSTSSDAFFAVRRFTPESLPAGTAHAFWGVRLDCAQCRDHPFDRWTQRQFWNMAVFYSGFSQNRDTPAEIAAVEQSDPGGLSIRIPGTGEIVPAVFLTGDSPVGEGQKLRSQLADWIVEKRNPRFAKMADASHKRWGKFSACRAIDF